MASGLLLNPVTTRTRRATLDVQREDICFWNNAPDQLRIKVRVLNVGDVRSQATTMILQAAPLGAFVPWKPLATVAVPPIEAGEAVDVSTDIAVPPMKALGDFSKVPPRRLLTAVSGEDEPRPNQQIGQRLAQTLWSLVRGNSQPRNTRLLPADPMELLLRKNTHWAGNINVLIGNQAVERHLAQALRIYPGTTNVAAFFVGSRPDQYQFTITGTGSSWDAALFDLSGLPSMLARRSETQPIPQSTWVRMDECRIVLLSVCPPADCQQGEVQVCIRQRSTNRDAIVEFSLDRHAAGAGCYTL